MFTVEIIQHFEDWFVVSETVGEFDEFGKAITTFSEECDNFLSNRFSGDSLDQYISENLADEDGDWSKGFIVEINKDEETIISRHFDYDYETRSIVGDYVNEFCEEGLSFLELSKLREILTRRIAGLS